jgi:hypothetical protein
MVMPGRFLPGYRGDRQIISVTAIGGGFNGSTQHIG